MKKFTKITIIAMAMTIVLMSCGQIDNTADDKQTDSKTAKSDIVNIGVMGPMAGELTWLGEGNANGAKLALKDFEAKNPEVKGKYKIILEDDQCDPTLAVNAYNKLKSEGVHAIVGNNCSGATLATAAVAMLDKTIMISPSATSPELTAAGDYLFRTSSSDTLAGKFAAKFMEKQGYKKVAINAKNDAWGQGLRDVFKQEFKGEVVMDEVHEAEASDFKSIIAQIKSSGADAVYAPTFPNEFQIFTKQMKELGVDVPIIGGDALNDNKVAENYGNEWSNKIIFVAGAVNGDENARKFNEEYKKEYGKDPATYASDSYDAMTILLQAYEAVGTNTDEIRDYLYAVESFPGASGKISFDTNGDSIAKDAAYFTFKDGNTTDFPANLSEKK